MKTVYLLLIALYITPCAKGQKCDEEANLKPMYGRIKKCPELLEADRQFFHFCDSVFKTRHEASAYFSGRAWQFFSDNDLETAMKRFNQAWMLDSNNAATYWGFGDILGRQTKYKESIPYLEHALVLDPRNTYLLNDAAINYFNLFFNSQDSAALYKSVEYTKRSVSIDPNKKTYRQLTAAYAYYPQKDSARKYMAITDKIDPTVIENELRAFVNEK